MHMAKRPSFIGLERPWQFTDKANKFLVDALYERFRGGPHKWHFHRATIMGKAWPVLEVIDRQLSENYSKLSFMEWINKVNLWPHWQEFLYMQLPAEKN